MNIFVSGAAGFIGSHLVENLAKLGHSVVGVDSFREDLYESRKRRKVWQELEAKFPNVSLFEFDLQQPRNFADLGDFSVVYHLAATPGLQLSWSNPNLYFNNNVMTTLNMIDGFLTSKPDKFFYISTSSVYGEFGVGDESMPLNPISPYGISKLAAEQLVINYCNFHVIPFNIFRPFSVYGPRQRDDMAYNIFFRKIMNGEEISIFGDGSQTRSNTYVTDIVNGLVNGIDSFRNSQIYNLSGSESFSLNDTLQLMEDIVGKKAKVKYHNFKPGDQKRTQGDFSKAEAEINYRPQISMREGLEQQYLWHLSQQS